MRKREREWVDGKSPFLKGKGAGSKNQLGANICEMYTYGGKLGCSGRRRRRLAAVSAGEWEKLQIRSFITRARSGGKSFSGGRKDYR